MTDTADRGKLMFTHRSKTGTLFEVFEAPASDGMGYVGYADGVRSVAASRPDLVLTGLSRKHLGTGMTAEVIDFRAAVEAMQKRQS